VKSIITTVKKQTKKQKRKRTLETIKKMSEGAKLQWKRLKSKGTVYKGAPMSQ
jgi:hypothetical protein